MALSDRLITLSRERSQQDRRPPSTPPLFGSGRTDGLQLAQFLSAELQGVPLPWEGHASLKHNPVEMYSYLENDDLVPQGLARSSSGLMERIRTLPTTLAEARDRIREIASMIGTMAA